MADVKPFRPLLFSVPNLASVVAPPYDVIDQDYREKLAKRSDYNIVNLDLPQGDSTEKYQRAAKLLEEWKEKRVLRQTDAEGLLVYEQEFDDPKSGERRKRRGFMGLVRATDYEDGDVLPHERTLRGPKEDRLRLFEATQASLSPIFLLYSDRKKAIEDALADVEFDTSFLYDDEIVHRVSFLTSASRIRAISSALSDQPLLIADGHHRYETAVAYAKKYGAQYPSAKYAMAYFTDGNSPGLCVFGTHRLVHGLKDWDRDSLLTKAADYFKISRLEPQADALLELEKAGRAGHAFVMVSEGEKILLETRLDSLVSSASYSQLSPSMQRTDVGILHSIVIEDLLGIDRLAQEKKTNLRYHKHLDQALSELKERGQALFLMNGTPVDSIRQTCLAGDVMPQKSTYFYPKVLTGLALHEF